MNSIWETDKEDFKELLKDMGFEEWQLIPGWAYDLAEIILNSGWKKRGVK